MLFKVGDQVWMVNKHRRVGENPKLEAKFVAPYHIVECFENHTYKLQRQGQTSVQNEGRLKLYRACPVTTGQAPTLLEPQQWPNMKGATRQPMEEEDPDQNWVIVPHNEPPFPTLQNRPLQTKGYL